MYNMAAGGEAFIVQVLLPGEISCYESFSFHDVYSRFSRLLKWFVYIPNYFSGHNEAERIDSEKCVPNLASTRGTTKPLAKQRLLLGVV